MGFDTASYKIGGHVTDLAAPYMPPQLAALLGATARMGPDIAMNAAAGLIGAVKGAPLVEDAAKNVMKIAVNPTPADLVSGKAGKAINFMLKNDISPTASNMLSLRNQITNLDSQVADVIKNSPETIKTGGIFESLKPAMDRFIRSGDPKDIATLRKAWTDFVNHPMIQGAEEIPIQTAQSIKTAKSSLLNSRLYGEMGSADTAAEKGLIHGLKTEIAAKAPEVVPLNELSSELRNVIDVSERKALMKLAHNPVDMAFVFSTPEHYAAYSLGRSKAFLGGMARILYHNKEILPAGAGSAAEALYADLKRRNDKSSDTPNP
jgi:hypothetical protein